VWLFTIYGFFSVVDAGSGRVQVRARNREHLAYFLDDIGWEWEIKESPEADYRWRVIFDGEMFAEMMLHLERQVRNIDNFKAAAKDHWGQSDPGYIKLLESVWRQAYTYQEEVSKS
jgi:hypothetical protein